MSSVLEVPPSQRVSLSVRNLSIAVKSQLKSKKKSSPKAVPPTTTSSSSSSSSNSASSSARILSDVSFDVPEASLVAIMGGLGSGKTTLLNALSQRVNILNPDLRFSGSIHYITRGADPLSSTQQISSKIANAYMLQTDAFLPGLTVFETLLFQAHLRMPRNIATAEKIELVDTLLRILDLEHLRESRVCKFGSLATTLSGGEQRRLSLAIQLLAKPAILFLDEPTTGLDTLSSLKLVTDLRRLASPQYGITVILLIHQPRTEIQALFDRICLLSRGGRVVFYGSMVDSVPYFASLGYIDAAPGLARNFVAYIMLLSIKDTSLASREAASAHRIDMLVESWRNHVKSLEYHRQPETDLGIEADSDAHFRSNLALFARDNRDSISLAREIVILTHRTWLLTLRDTGALLALNGGSAILAVATGWMFWRPYPDLSGIRSITSVLYVVLEIVGFCPMFFEIERLWAVDGVFFRREHNENVVSVPGFLISRRLGKFWLEDLPMALIFAVITFFMWGLRSSASSFGIYFSITLLTNLIAMVSALFAFAISPVFSISSLIINIYYQVQNSACGYFVNAKTMPIYVRWTKYLAYFWAGFGALSANQYSDWHGACPYQDINDPRCVQFLGNYQLDVLGYPVHWIAQPICIMLGWLCGFSLFTGLFLHFKSFTVEVLKTKKNTIGGGEEEEEEQEAKRENKPERHDDENKSVSGNLKPSGDDSFASSNGLELMEYTCTTSRDDNSRSNLLTPVLLTEKVPTKQSLSRSGSDKAAASTSPSILINVRNVSLNVVTTNLITRKRTDKILLENVSADFAANSVNVIMGPSGLGKTTLLNYLAQRLPRASTFKTIGDTFLNEIQPISPSSLAKILGYVTQHDNALLPQLTVRETLYYQARLRLPLAEHHAIPSIVFQLIRKIGLSDCAETLIGLEFLKGISGGEKRRVSIAVQLLSRPKVLFLDEPTSGLDSTTAEKILNLLATLARENSTTIILTIHQPQQELFSNFGSLLLLVRGGKVAYNGKADGIERYLESCGYLHPVDVNVADYMLDIVSRAELEDHTLYQFRVDYLVSVWAQRVRHDEHHPITFESLRLLNNVSRKQIDVKSFYRKRLPTRVTFAAVLSRQVKTFLRTRDVILARMGQTIVLGIVHALYFAPLKNGPSGISNRLGLLQEVLNLFFVGLINNITLFPIERNIFYQEYHDSIYGVFEFTTLYLVNELPFEILPCLFLTVMVVLVVGLPRNASMFFGMFVSSFVLVNCGELIGMFINSCFNHLGVATNIVTNAATLAIFMGGTMSLQLPVFFKGINYVNPLNYVVSITAKLGFKDQTFDCGLDTCDLSNGQQVLETYGFDKRLSLLWLGLILCMIVYRVIAVALVYVRVKYWN